MAEPSAESEFVTNEQMLQAVQNVHEAEKQQHDKEQNQATYATGYPMQQQQPVTTTNNGHEFHWGSPTNPLDNTAYHQEDYNALRPELSHDLWNATSYPAPPPLGVPYAYPAPPAAGIEPPRMGFYHSDPNVAILGRPVDHTQLPAFNSDPSSVPINNNEIQQHQFGGWSQPQAPGHGMNAREWCSMIWSLVMQSCVQIHLIFLAICFANPNASGNNGVCNNYFWKGGLISGDVSTAFIVVVSVTGGLYLIDSFYNPFSSYVWNLRTRVESYQFLAKLSDTRPNLWWHIQCYHYETRTYRDSKGRTQTRQVRVNTHSASGHYAFSSWRNIGPPPLISAVKAMRIRLDKEYTFADAETKSDYDMKFAGFIAANDRDTHKDVSSGFDIEGFEDYFLSMIKDNEGESSFAWFCYKTHWYWISTVLVMSGFFRMILVGGTNSMSYTFVKEVKK
jgi:hypothetical protein